MRAGIRVVVTLAAMVVLGTGMPGCSDRGKKEKRIHRIDGIARKVDLKNNVVSMSVHDKEGREREIPGSIREDTEVSINGRVVKLDEVREGDKITVAYYREGKDEAMKFWVTKVEVTRSAEGDWKSTQTPTTQPAGPSGKP